MRMSELALLLLAATIAGAQQPPADEPQLKSRPEAAAAQGVTPMPGNVVVLPAGTKIPIALKQPVSTRGAQTDEAIYAQTTFDHRRRARDHSCRHVRPGRVGSREARRIDGKGRRYVR